MIVGIIITQITIPQWPAREPIYLPYGAHHKPPQGAPKRHAHPANVVSLCYTLIFSLNKLKSDLKVKTFGSHMLHNFWVYMYIFNGTEMLARKTKYFSAK